MSKIVPRMRMANEFDEEIVQFLIIHNIQSEVVHYDTWTFLLVNRTSMCNAISGFDENGCYEFVLLLIQEYLATINSDVYAVWGYRDDDALTLDVWMPPN